MHFGVVPQEMQATPDLTSLIERIDELVVEKKFAQPKDRIVIIAGWSPGTAGSMNGIVIHVVGESWTPVPTAQQMRQMVRAERE